MGLRALVGVENAGGHYQARSVHCDGNPALMVPVLSSLVHLVHRHDQSAAVERLMAHDWWRLFHQPHPVAGDWLIGDRAAYESEPYRGRLDGDDPGDREWAYLFGGHRLHVYLAVHGGDGGRKSWEPWACWSVHGLNSVSYMELLSVQHAGYDRRWKTGEGARYMRLLREHPGRGVR